MLKDIQLQDGDFVSDGDGSFVVLEGADAVAQNMRHICELFLGEFFLEPGKGIDFRKLGEKGTSLAEIRDGIVDALRQEPAIESIDSFTIEKGSEPRSLVVDWDVTISGERVTGKETF